MSRLSILGLALFLLSTPTAFGDDPPKKWDLDHVLEELTLHPKDAYLQYVALQLGRRENRDQEVIAIVERLQPGQNRGRRDQTNLFATFTGALAIQESLQLDTMRGDNRRPNIKDGVKRKGEDPAVPVAIGKLLGPAQKSHPWATLLGTKKPVIGPMANLVPEEFWFAEVRSITKANELSGLGEMLGGHAFTQALGEANSQLTQERIRAQLGLMQLPPKLLDGIKIEGMALTGSDLFHGEGSDITVLIQCDGLVAALAIGEALLRRGAKRETGKHVEIGYAHTFSEDGTLNVYTATPRPNLHVRGNSLPAFKRVLECVAGKTVDGKPARRLGESKEFQYVRSLLPHRAAEEDAFVYLSDAFIHRLVGATLKVTERRRVQVYNHLRMIGHACLMFRTEFGRAPKSLAELTESKCAPEKFGEGDLTHPDGGTYSLAADGMAGVCSKWGRIDALKPCLEGLVTDATHEEMAEYNQFVAQYSEYWRTFFDPIAIRVAVGEKELRLETLILPLIDNSIYTMMAQVLGGPAVALDTLPTAKREIGGAWLHFNKKPILDALGPDTKPVAKVPEPKRGGKPVRTAENDLKQIGLAIHNYHDVNNKFPATIRDADGKPLLSWRVLILPYIEDAGIYKQFKLDEPWDSPNNKALIEKMPKTFSGPKGAGKTCYLAPSGKDTIFPSDDKETSMASVTDGLSNTIMVVESNEDAAVIWSKPDDWEFDAAKPTKGLNRVGSDFFLALMADGSTKRIRLDVEPKMLAWAFIRNDGNVYSLEPRPAPRAEPIRPKTIGDLVNDLKQIGLGMHGMESAYMHFPPAAWAFDPVKKHPMSWRVAMLPYIEQDNLFRMYKPDEPWDSENNKKLIPLMPRLYQGLNPKLNEAFKTTLVLPVGKETMFKPDGEKLKITEVTDGLSNTIMATFATDDRAVVWTKPEDLPYDPKDPTKGLRLAPDGLLVAMGDGSVRRFAAKIKPSTIGQLMTRAGAEIIDIDADEELPTPRGNQDRAFVNDWFHLSDQDKADLERVIDLNKVRRCLREGIGDQIGFHLYDGSRMLDYETAGVLGGGALFARERLGPIEMFGVAAVVQFLSSPAAISIPVKVAKAVDEFLGELDLLFVKGQLHSALDIGRLRDSLDLYKMQTGDTTVRVLAIRGLGLKLRLFIARIGDGLYIANRPFLIDDLIAAAGGPKPKGDSGHAHVRVRPENWNEVLPGYRLGWAEQNRAGCLDNLGPIANAARGWNDREVNATALDHVRKVYGVRPFCPDGGTYSLSTKGECSCSIHGDPRNPKQPAAPSADSPTGRWLKTFTGARATLTFQEDGLRAVVVVERK